MIVVQSKQIKLFEKIVNILLNILIIIFAFILLVSIYNNIQISILKNDYSSFFGYSLFEVQTGSMSGTIEVGDWIVVKETNDIELDDIITYKQGDEFTTHRVIEKYNDTYVTKGDVNNTKDEPITDKEIVGKVVKILPHFGILRKTLFNPLVVVSLIITLFLISFALKKEDKEKELKLKKKMEEVISKVKDKEKVKEIVEEKPKEKVDKPKERIKMNFRKKIDHSKDIPKVKSNSKVKINKISGSDDDIEVLDVDDISTDEDLDKTMYFRMIQVDKDEIEKTYSKIKESKEENEIIIDDNEDEKENTKEEVIKHNLELIQNKRKKCKTIIEKAMVIKEDELEELIKVLNFNQEFKVNEPTIKDTLLKSYIDARYYNNCGDINVSYDGRNVGAKLEKVIDNTSFEMIRTYKGNDSKFKDKVMKFNTIFKIITYIEKYAKIQDLDDKKNKYRNKLKEYLNNDFLTDDLANKLVSKLIKITKTYNNMLKYSLEKMQTNLFKIKYNRVDNGKIFALEIDHNLSFSKIYSDYIIEKTYNEEGVVFDRLAVLINILSTRIVVNMLKGDFASKYLLYIPYNLYAKTNKINDIFEMFVDEFAKNSIVVLINYDEIDDDKAMIKSLVKKGYKFAINIDDNNINDKDLELMYIVDYIFVLNEENKKRIPKDLRGKVIVEDIRGKVN